jgi:hypothetical protein
LSRSFPLFNRITIYTIIGLLGGQVLIGADEFIASALAEFRSSRAEIGPLLRSHPLRDYLGSELTWREDSKDTKEKASITVAA